MKLRFDPNQEYQQHAIEAVTGLFEGQARVEAELRLALGAGFSAVANRLELDEASLLDNLKTVQGDHGIPADEGLKTITETVHTADGEAETAFLNFSVEMETGTGKTYVYIRTALELSKRYGMKKFIVVVPSVAVREGVLKTFAITKNHFSELYDNLPYRFYGYKSANLSQVRQFALSDCTEFMVMTIDSFNKELNVIRQSTDRLQGETPIHLIQATRPILILDEPQNMESEKSVAALAGLCPLYALRYSATHRNPYNLVYRLTPYDAYRQGLVKRIEVDAVVQSDDENRPYIRLEKVESAKKTLKTKMRVHVLQKSGTVKEKSLTVKPGDDLEKKTRRPEYAGYVVDEISVADEWVRFANDVELAVGQEVGADKDAIFEAQIRSTVEEHIRRQKKLKDFGIKVLSLFFIDKVANYADEDGIIRRLFNEAFDDLKAGYPDWKDLDADAVQAAYFAQKRSRKGEVTLEDSSTGTAQKDVEAYDLIMKDKERLLSFDEPVSFVFSHSALREGWDNPNVFQICTLNQSSSEMKKRQEVGRGVRLAVDQDGERNHDERVNVLTVVANESYERYAATLQSEIEAEYGKDGAPPPPANKRKRGKAKLRKKRLLKPEFKELWARIKHKTRYSVTIDTERLLQDALPGIDAISVKPPRVTVTKAQLSVDSEGEGFMAQQMTAEHAAVYLNKKRPLPNLLEIMLNLLENTTPPVRLTRRTLLEVIKRASNKSAIMDNPHEFATEATKLLKEALAEQLVKGIQYEKTGEWYEMEKASGEGFEELIESWKDYLVPAANSIYDNVVVDSDVEREFVQDLEARDDVELYVKLPGWFIVRTPVGEYNPDWALVMHPTDDPHGAAGKPLLYLVRETKGTGELRPTERRKTVCGKAHFEGALGVSYRVVTAASELPSCRRTPRF